MTPDPPGSPSADAFEDEKLIVDGLERAVAQARRKIPDHDDAAEVVFPSPTQPAEPSEQEVAAPVPLDSSAVMEVLRDAIDRYAVMGVLEAVVDRRTKPDVRDQGAWAEELARANDSGPVVGDARSLTAGYAPDRRRLAAFVVVLFLLAGGFGYSRFGTDSAEKVNTNTVPTQGGQAVTIVTRPSTSAAPLPPPTEAPITAVASTVSPSTSTTARQRGTTVPPSTAPTTTEPPTTDTTTSTTDTTTAATTRTLAMN